MGKDVDPWIYCPHSPWRFSSFNCMSSLRQPIVGPQNTNSMMFPTYFNPSGCAFYGNATPPFPVFQAQRILPKTPTWISPYVHTRGPTGFADSQKRFLVFDHSGDQTSLIFSPSGTPFVSLMSMNPAPDMQGSNETNISDGHGGEEMHEDTEEIDALLYSDFDDEEEEAAVSMGHSPMKMAAESVEEGPSMASGAEGRRSRADRGTCAEKQREVEVRRRRGRRGGDRGRMGGPAQRSRGRRR
uniref:Transcription factor bHLH145-like n=1 Tax=Elaeis guineensis var. tenera TaxID=51953 RepID=A0A8N4EYB4_ELAGV|nr:transcription factor bHLH145-like [Elaeis guineensis]